MINIAIKFKLMKSRIFVLICFQFRRGDVPSSLSLTLDRRMEFFVFWFYSVGNKT